MARDSKAVPESHHSPSSPPETNQEILCEETRRIVRRKARRLRAKAGPQQADVEDFEHDLIAALLEAAKSFDAQLGLWLPFAERALQFSSNKQLRKAYCKKRDNRGNVSLQIMVKVGDEEYTELSQLITRDDAERRTAAYTRDERDLVDLRLDLTDFIAQLPREFRELARARKWESILEMFRRTGTSRSTLYSRLKRLCELAEKFELDEYFR